MTAGLIAILVALAVATAFGLFWKSRNGRVVRLDCSPEERPARPATTAIREPATVPGGRAAQTPNPDGLETAMPGDAGESAPGKAAAGCAGLSAEDLGAALGRRATLVQFSSAFCAPCRATRRILADVADMADGVTHVEIDAESRLDLVRRLDVRRTPTTLILGPDGLVTHRASGQPRKADVVAAVGAVA